MRDLCDWNKHLRLHLHRIQWYKEIINFRHCSQRIHKLKLNAYTPVKILGHKKANMNGMTSPSDEEKRINLSFSYLSELQAVLLEIG